MRRGKRRSSETFAGQVRRKRGVHEGVWQKAAMAGDRGALQRPADSLSFRFRGTRYNGVSISHEKAYAVAAVTL